jgi:hypothetical protein
LGTVFEIAKTAVGYASTPTVLANFGDTSAPTVPGNDTNGVFPLGKLIADAAGNLFGTTEQGFAGAYAGTVFEITNSGFVV